MFYLITYPICQQHRKEGDGDSRKGVFDVEISFSGILMPQPDDVTDIWKNKEIAFSGEGRHQHVKKAIGRAVVYQEEQFIIKAK